MSQAEEGHAGGKKKAGYVKGDLDFWVRTFDDPGEVSWEQVSRDDRELAAVGKGDTEAKDQITCCKIKYPQGMVRGRVLIRISWISTIFPKAKPAAKLNR